MSVKNVYLFIYNLHIIRNKLSWSFIIQYNTPCAAAVYSWNVRWWIYIEDRGSMAISMIQGIYMQVGGVTSTQHLIVLSTCIGGDYDTSWFSYYAPVPLCRICPWTCTNVKSLKFAPIPVGESTDHVNFSFELGSFSIMVRK